MAKYGEGDPRWIVQDRADGKNVNNWHWTEKDCTEWTRQRLLDIFQGLVLVDDQVLKVATTSLQALDGEVLLNTRKNKIIPSYELNIKFRWEGSIKDGDGATVASTTGTIQIPYLADENADEDPEVRVIPDSTDSAADRLKSAILSKGKAAIFKGIQQYLGELQAGGPGGKAAAPAPLASVTAAEKNSAPSHSNSGQLAAGANKTTKEAPAYTRLNLKETFYARPSDLYSVFVEENRVKAFTQSDAQVAPKVGGKFSWLNGSVTGEFEELLENKKIVMKWRFNTWEDGCFSTVVLDLEQPEDGMTVCHLQQTGIPETDKFSNADVKDTVERGWKEQVFRRMRVVFGYGA